MLSDIFPTGWTSLDYAGFSAGDSVAVFGAGPVGSDGNLLRRPARCLSRVYSVYYEPDRLGLAESIGAIPINFRDVDRVPRILALEPNGMTRSIDAVGYEKVTRDLTVRSDIVTHSMLAVMAAWARWAWTTPSRTIRKRRRARLDR